MNRVEEEGACVHSSLHLQWQCQTHNNIYLHAHMRLPESQVLKDRSLLYTNCKLALMVPESRFIMLHSLQASLETQ